MKVKTTNALMKYLRQQHNIFNLCNSIVIINNFSFFKKSLY